MTTEEGALIEPLAVGLHATGLGNVGLGDEVLILGGGCIGLVTLLSAKARGASKIVVVDLYEKRLNMAKQLGATDVIQAGTENVEERIGELFNGKGRRHRVRNGRRDPDDPADAVFREKAEP